MDLSSERLARMAFTRASEPSSSMATSSGKPHCCRKDTPFGASPSKPRDEDSIAATRSASSSTTSRCSAIPKSFSSRHLLAASRPLAASPPVACFKPAADCGMPWALRSPASRANSRLPSTSTIRDIRSVTCCEMALTLASSSGKPRDEVNPLLWRSSSSWSCCTCCSTAATFKSPLDVWWFKRLTCSTTSQSVRFKPASRDTSAFSGPPHWAPWSSSHSTRRRRSCTSSATSKARSSSSSPPALFAPSSETCGNGAECFSRRSRSSKTSRS
mmetsp:Transcript_46240/g.128664  ORF Transcript_46240/g.128664 Transcript_46240/m.128664 type:complete len:272 (-) Transcript_46240:1201-2016(-)